jgi:phenylalanyl-tRNA synthetase beta chain
VRLPYHWLRDLVKVPGDSESIAATLGLRGFEVASIEHEPQPVIDFEITANRPDCLSVIGLAREAAAAFQLPLELPDRTPPASVDGMPIDVSIEDAELCPRYCAQVFEVIGQYATPDWMRERLEAAGVRSIGVIVDVTNYVMLEMGHPTHAFDLSKLSGGVLRIRRAKPQEKVRTLDGIERALDADILVIADAEWPQAIGGVMGGADSEIDSGTRLMVLESAYFKPASVRQTSKRLGLKTEASTRFERGADIEAPPAAISRVARLLHDVGVARPIGPAIDRYPSPAKPIELSLRARRIGRILGVSVPDVEVPKILEPLGFEVRPVSGIPPNDGSTWAIRVPTFRVDVLREVDLVEEIARHDGYRGLPSTFPALRDPQPPPDARTLRDRRIRHVLTASGMSEAMTFAFIESQAAELFAQQSAIVPVANPLSEKYNVLRPSLIPGLLDAAAYNRRRERRDIRLFETGTRFSRDSEVRAVAGVWCGEAASTHWAGAARPVDFFDVKGIVEALGRALGVEIEFEPTSARYFVEGRAARIFRVTAEAANSPSALRAKIGDLGQIAPEILEARGFPPNEGLFGFEIDVDQLPAAEAVDDLRVQPLPRFPSIVRDLSVLVDSGLPAATIRGTIRSAAPNTLVHVVEFDRYRGAGVPEGRVSLSLRLTFRSPDRTLTDAEVDAAMAAIVAALETKHGAVRR